MKIRMKRAGIFGKRRLMEEATIDSIVINENLLHPEKESASIFFKGKGASGILNLTLEEINSLFQSIKPNIGLITRNLDKASKSKGKSKKKK